MFFSILLNLAPRIYTNFQAMKLFQTNVNAGLVRLGIQVVELSNKRDSVDEFGPCIFLTTLQDEVQYLTQTHFGMTKYFALRNATRLQKPAWDQSLPKSLIGP
jgi:hypothetical protein